MFESEADVRRSMGEAPGVWSGGKKFRTFQTKGGVSYRDSCVA